MPFLKSLAVAIWTRVVVNYKPTLIGMGIAILILVADASVAALQALPEGWAQIAASVVAMIGAFLRSKQPAPADLKPVE